MDAQKAELGRTLGHPSDDGRGWEERTQAGVERIECLLRQFRISLPSFAGLGSEPTRPQYVASFVRCICWPAIASSLNLLMRLQWAFVRSFVGGSYLISSLLFSCMRPAIVNTSRSEERERERERARKVGA